MNEHQVQLIRDSWGAISMNPYAMMNFYELLFKKAPEARHFFPDDMTKQSEKLALTIGFVVGNLDRIDDIKDAIEDLGRFHNRLNIEASYYGLVRDSLIETIAKVMGESYRQEIGTAWEIALNLVSDLMINAPEKRTSRFRRLLDSFFSVEA